MTTAGTLHLVLGYGDGWGAVMPSAGLRWGWGGWRAQEQTSTPAFWFTGQNKDTEAERGCSKKLAKQGKQQVQMLWTQRVSYSGGVHQDSDPNSELSNCVYFTMLRFYILTFHNTPYNFYKGKNRSGRKNFTPLSFSILLDLNLLK